MPKMTSFIFQLTLFRMSPQHKCKLKELELGLKPERERAVQV